MSILIENQNNFGMDKYKLLSSTSGVGSIVANKTGNFILISSIDKWPFIKQAIDIIKNEREINRATALEESKKIINVSLGLTSIDDSRFIGFLRSSENLSELLLLLSIPEMELDDIFNTANDWKNHPIKKLSLNAQSIDYMIQASYFPKWFIGNKDLKTIDEWRKDWKKLVENNQNVKTSHFAPPRNPKSLKKANVERKIDVDGNYEIMDIYNELTQTNLALICENGHLMDIPWSKYINYNNISGKPIDFSTINHCCTNPVLKWTEATNKAEGFENVYVECKSCGTKKNLAGISSLTCLCTGNKPWQLKIDGGFDEARTMPSENCTFNNNQGIMHLSLVTANRMYYGSSKNSLYIPLKLKPEGFENQELVKALKFCEASFKRIMERNQSLKKESWFENKVDEDFLIDSAGIDSEIITEDFISKLKLIFFDMDDNIPQDIEYDDENYRLFEYKCFIGSNNVNENGLRFNEIDLPGNLVNYFSSIKQVTELKVTQVQLSFNRNRPMTSYKDTNGAVKKSSNSQRIFEGKDQEQFILPAVENYGEGIFLQFNEEAIYNLLKDQRIQNILDRNLSQQDQGFNISEILKGCGQKYFVIHSFAHLLMRELEFTCGYPTASLKERLYISSAGKEFMAGVLIYTTEGSEGSMGGLVSQSSEHKIFNLIKKALLRGVDCSSDPLCWESEGQGLFGFNLASCFSCSLVAETACEAMNLGLDRRVLVDEEFGYFKNLIQ